MTRTPDPDDRPDLATSMLLLERRFRDRADAVRARDDLTYEQRNAELDKIYVAASPVRSRDPVVRRLRREIRSLAASELS